MAGSAVGDNSPRSSSWTFVSSWCVCYQVVVFTGLIEILGSEDELAAVLAHETAHVLARHHVSREEGGEASTETALPEGSIEA